MVRCSTRALTLVCSGARRGLHLCPRCLLRVHLRVRSYLRQVSVGAAAPLSFVRMNFVLSLDIPLFTVAWPPLKEDVVRRYPLWDYSGTRNSWNTSRYLSLRVPEHHPWGALDRASTDGSSTEDWTDALIRHAAATESYASKFVPVSGLVWNAPRTRAIKRRIKLRGDRPKSASELPAKAKNECICIPVRNSSATLGRTCVKRMPRCFLLVSVVC